MSRTKTPVADTKGHHVLGPRLREGAFIGVSAICLYLLLALLTYSPRDPGWSATGTGNAPNGSRCANAPRSPRTFTTPCCRPWR